MADRIYIDTELLEQISVQLSQVKKTLSEIASSVTSSVNEVRHVASSQTATITKLSNAQKNTQFTVDHADKLAKAVRFSADLWADSEKRVSLQQLSAGTDIKKGAEVFKDVDHWSSGQQKIDWNSIVWNPFIKTMPLIFPGTGILIGALSDPGVRDVLYNFFTNKYSGSGAILKGEANYNGFFAKGELLGGSYKTKGSASFDIKSGNFGIKQSISGEVHLAQTEFGYKGKYGEIGNKTTVGGASATGEVGATLFSDGEFKPSIYAKAKGEAYVFRNELSGKLGTDDLNVYGKKEVTLLGAEAEAKAGFKDGKFEAKAGAEAYVAKGEVSGGIDIFGIKIGAKGEAMVGVNATAGGKVGTSSAEGEIGLGPFKVSINIDWSGFTKRFF